LSEVRRNQWNLKNRSYTAAGARRGPVSNTHTHTRKSTRKRAHTHTYERARFVVMNLLHSRL